MSSNVNCMFFFLLGTETHIADLVLTSELTTSNWGDRRLFFRHQNMADDVMLKPEWDPYLEKVSPSIQTCPGREPKNRRERESFCIGMQHSHSKWLYLLVKYCH